MSYRSRFKLKIAVRQPELTNVTETLIDGYWGTCA